MILSPLAASISELQKDPLALLEEANGEPVVILYDNRPFVYLVPADVYENMLKLIEDYKLDKMIRERLAKEKDDAIAVSLENL